MTFNYYGLNKELDRKVKAIAKTYDDRQRFADDLGWEDWMEEILIAAGIPSEEELTEVQTDTINKYLDDVWEAVQTEKYKEEHSKKNYKHIHVKVPNYMTDVVEKLENEPNVNGYIISLIQKDVETLDRIVGIPQKGNGRIRNERLLQRFSPSTVRVCMSGKKVDYVDSLDADKKEYWVEVFKNAIEDLENGLRINGKGEKNDPDYWRKQLARLEY